MTIEELKNQGYYIRVSIDDRQKLREYTLTKDLSNTERMIHCELNRAGYLLAKNKLGFTVKKFRTNFLNSIPFADRDKDNYPKMEFYTKN